MQHIYQKNIAGYGSLAYDNFSSIAEMIEVNKHRPLGKNFNRGSLASRTGDYSFTKTNSFEEALHLLEHGWDEPLQKVKEKLGTYEKLHTQKAAQRVQTRHHIVGVAPCVPRALMGLPNSMIEYKRQPTIQKTLRIMYNITAVWSYTTEQLLDAGIAILALANTVERMGIRVRVDVCEAATGYDSYGGGSQVAGWSITIKDYRQPIDLRKLCFPISHPSMLRRISFDWLEKLPEAVRGFNSGYGSPYYEFGNKPELIAAVSKGEPFVYFSTKEVINIGYDVNKMLHKASLATDKEGV